MSNKRKHDRIMKNIKSEVVSEEGLTYSTAIDISRGGIFIATPEPLSQGAKLSLSIQTPEGKTIDLNGIVRWTRNEETDKVKAGMGIEFIHIKESEEAMRSLFG